jgi:hypothetical protein
VCETHAPTGATPKTACDERQTPTDGHSSPTRRYPPSHGLDAGAEWLVDLLSQVTTDLDTFGSPWKSIPGRDVGLNATFPSLRIRNSSSELASGEPMSSPLRRAPGAGIEPASRP